MDVSGHDIQFCRAVESKLDHIPLTVSSSHEEFGNQQYSPTNTHTRDDHLDLTPCPDIKTLRDDTAAHVLDCFELADVEGETPGGEDETCCDTSDSGPFSSSEEGVNGGEEEEGVEGEVGGFLKVVSGRSVVARIVVRSVDLEAGKECAKVGGGEEKEEGADDSEGEGEEGLMLGCE